MTDHANELRRYARKIAHPAGDVPAVMRAAVIAERVESQNSAAIWQRRPQQAAMERLAVRPARHFAQVRTSVVLCGF